MASVSHLTIIIIIMLWCSPRAFDVSSALHITATWTPLHKNKMKKGTCIYLFKVMCALDFYLSGSSCKSVSAEHIIIICIKLDSTWPTQNKLHMPQMILNFIICICLCMCFANVQNQSSEYALSKRECLWSKLWWMHIKSE
jgi:hypothetical protein